MCGGPKIRITGPRDRVLPAGNYLLGLTRLARLHQAQALEDPLYPALGECESLVSMTRVPATKAGWARYLYWMQQGRPLLNITGA